MRIHSLSSSDSNLPHFGLVVPTQWNRVDTGDEAKIKEIGDQLTELLPDESETRIREDVFDYWRSLVDTNVTQYFTYARAIGDKALLCSIGRFDADANQSFQDIAQTLFRSLDQGWETSPPMFSMHNGSNLEYFRAERLIIEPGKWPWDASREIQYLFGHPEFSVYVLLTAVSPNTQVHALTNQFDEVAESFFWLPT